MVTQRAAQSNVSATGILPAAMSLGHALAVVRRLEFYVVELTIFSIPLLVVADDVHDLARPVVFEGLIMYFVLYAIGDMVNCLADRDLDNVYKTRLSRAVYRIGPSRLGWIVAIETLVGLGLAVHLSMVTGRWLILLLVLLGVFLGLAYSLGPLHLKKRGLGHLACLWSLLYFLPMVCAALIIAGPNIKVLVVAAAYATVEMGIILVNTSEDLLEDRAAGIRTTTVALGLTLTLRLASTMVGLGGAGFCAFWVLTYADERVHPLGYLAVGVFAAVCAVVLARMIWLTLRVNAKKEEEEAAVLLVKAHGPLVPIAATLVGWVGVLCAAIPLTAGGG